MVLKATHDKLDDIPTEYQSLYTEKNGKFELTGISEVKTQGDVDRIKTALEKEKKEHKDTKTKLSVWGDLDHDEVVENMDKIPELEAAAKGNLDEAQIDEIVDRRVEGTLKSKLAPVERSLKEATKERDDFKLENDGFRATDRTRRIHDKVRSALVKSKVLPDAQEDALLLADRVFEIREDDAAIVTRDNVGITPGLDPESWLTDIQEKRRHWWPESVGGGSKGSVVGVGGMGGQNPWTEEHWNMTKQGVFFREHGVDRAEAMAKAAGTTVGGRKPQPKKVAQT